MKKRTCDKIYRPALSDCYTESMVEFLCRTRGVHPTEARAFVVEYIKKNVKVPKVKIVNMVTPGNAEIQTISLSHLLRIVQDKIITPSGSVFKPVYEQQSVAGNMVKKYMKNRGSVKKLQLKAEAEGRGEEATLFKALQNSIKVTLNSLPGGYGYPASIFYDKGCYNAITSAGRLLISTAFVCCEQLLAGNIPLFSIAEAINLLIQITLKAPSDVEIRSVMNKYELTWVTAEQVTTYLNESLQRYSFVSDLTKDVEFNRLISTLSREKLQFVWYHSNLKHICFNHTIYFKRLILEALDVSRINTEHIQYTPEAFWKLDGNLMVVAAMALAEELDGATFDVIATKPEQAKRLMAVCEHIQNLNHTLAELMRVFMYHNIIYQKILSRNQMQRECVVVSDTDSVIYTMHNWSVWFTGQSACVNADSYRIATLITCWLTDITADSLAKFVISSGGVDEGVSLIKMKNEFTYPIFLLFELKKVYAALTAIQEGVMFKKLKPDIKGASIRGVTASKVARKFITEVMVNDIMQPAIAGNISALTLINKVVKFENEVKANILAGNLDFIPISSVRSASSYKKPKSSTHFNLMAWNAIFGKKYDVMHPPDKLPLLKVLPPSDSYFDWLKIEYPDIHTNFKAFFAEHGKHPSAFFINPVWKRIPPELMPIINLREIVYFNINPIYLTLSSVNINVGFSDSCTLLSDIYSGVPNEPTC